MEIAEAWACWRDRRAGGGDLVMVSSVVVEVTATGAGTGAGAGEGVGKLGILWEREGETPGDLDLPFDVDLIAGEAGSGVRGNEKVNSGTEVMLVIVM